MKNYVMARKFRSILAHMSILRRAISLVVFLGILLISFNLPYSYALSNDSGNKCTDPATRMESWDYHVKLKNESKFKDLKWRAVGPRFIGGRIESIAVPSGNNYTIYVGVGAGNIWKTINNGVTWESIFENESTFTIGEISICPSNPDIIWVGTGEVLMARSSYAGTGIFKSTDAGKTWRNMGLHDTHHIGRVLIDPKNPDVVYVAAIGHNFSYNKQRGLFKTTDGGKTWEKSLYISEKIGVIDVEMDPRDNNTLYAATWERSRKAWGHTVCGTGSAIYKSTNAGRSWKRITNGFITGKYVGRITLEVSASNPDILYALVDNEAPRPEQSTRGTRGYRRSRTIRGEVYRSDNKGETWRKVNEDYLGTTIGYDFNLMRISPDNENEIWVGGNRFLTSKDGGKTYRQIETTIVHLMPKPKKLFSLDQHALWIDPANTNHLILGNDHGLYFTYDRGDNWLHMNNLPIGEFYAVSVDMATPYNIYGGNQDNAAVKGSSDFEIADGVDDPWEYVFLDTWGGGDGFITLADPTDTDKVYFFSGHSVSLKDMKTGRSKRITPRANPGDPPLRFNWMTPMIISPHDPRTLYYGANKLFKSTNKGTSWTCISPDLSTNPGPERRGNIPYGTCTTISESPIKPGLIYIGTDDGNIQVTQNDGQSWKKINTGPSGKWVTRVTASKYEEGTVYACLTGYREDDFEKYLYVSTDYGKTWKSIAGNLPSEPVNVIKEDPQNKNVLYVGTDLGAYTSIDRGKSWISLCNNLPTTPVYDLVVHPRDNELVIGTHGRSIFVLDVKPIQRYNAKR